MKKTYISLAFAASLALTSCSDFLDKEPSTSLPSGSAITTVTDLENAINGICYILIENGRMGYASEFGLYGDLRCNDFTIIKSNGQTEAISSYVNTGTDYPSNDSYKTFYMALANVNNALESIEKGNVEGDETEINNYKGQLLAWRGLMHFDLARIFCKIPSTVADPSKELGLVISDKVFPIDYKGLRTDLKSTYDFIIAQFTEAIPLIDSDNGVGYINKATAQALRARAYLYNGEYQKALADANEVINNSGFRLLGIDNYVSSWSKEGQDESIFELTVSDKYNAQRYGLGYYTDASGYAECGFNTEAYLYKYLASNPKDVRSGLIKDQTAEKSAGYYPNKYPGRDGNIYLNNPKIVRLSEMYLIAAEAQWHLDNAATASASIDVKATSAKAAEYINAINEKRIADYEALSEVSLSDILHAWEIEMFLENQITYAYWRNKQSVTSRTSQEIKYDDYRVLQPIPQAEIDYNKDLQQNEGY